MPLNFNVAPWYDDFDASKNYHRILFKPGFAVQARELTQAQTILQDQITKFADNIFKQNSPVTGGQVTTNLRCNYIKLQSSYQGTSIDLDLFDGQLIQDTTGLITARVLGVVPGTGEVGVGDPPTLVVAYNSGNQFAANSLLKISLTNTFAQVSTEADAIGDSSVASIDQGVFYISSSYKNTEGITVSYGSFVQVNPQTTVLSKYSNSPNARVGLNITETVYDYINDTSLLDPAVGASNYQAPGADRYVIKLTLESRPLTFGDDDGFIELIRVENGSIAKIVDGSVYNVIDDYFAKRDYETNGDYVVNDFKLTPKPYTPNSSKYTMSVGKGIAYVHGYRIENPIQLDILTNRARTTATQNNNPVYFDVGNYFYVNSVNGANGSFFDITTTQKVDLHCVPTSRITVGSEAAYKSTLVSTGYIRNLTYDHTGGSSANANSYIYKAYVNDLVGNTATGTAQSGTTATITLPTTYTSQNDAYVGVSITLTGGTGAGDIRNIIGYNGSTKVATVNQNWTTTPDSTTTFALNFNLTHVESLMSLASPGTYPSNIVGKAEIDVTSKFGSTANGDTILQSGGSPEMIFKLGNPYVSSLTNTSYETTQVWRSVNFTASGGFTTAELDYSSGSPNYSGIIKFLGTAGTTLSSDLIKQCFTIIVTNKGSNTNLAVGDIIPWVSSVNSNRSVALDATGGKASFTTVSADITYTFVATVIAKVYVQNAGATTILKQKTLVSANTTGLFSGFSTVSPSSSSVSGDSNTFIDTASYGQVYIKNAGIVSPGTRQPLYLVDIKSIVKIIDSGSSATAINAGMLSASQYDITANFNFDNGQRDNFYDHAAITLRPGAPKPAGNILVLVNYYSHTGGDGYFSRMSYGNENYEQIGNYQSSDGVIYPLRDSIDFRPSRLNNTTSFTFRYADTGDSLNRSGTLLPDDLSLFTGDYAYYLGRKDKLVLTKDKSFLVIEGSPSLTPLPPAEPDGSLVIANLTLNPYTAFLPTETPAGFTPNLSIEKVQHKRYTMQDIAGLETRINQVEYYTALNSLEQSAQSLQISDAYGLNRFKNGFLTDDFSSYATADAYNSDYLATINKRIRQMTASQLVNNYPLKAFALAYNMGSISPTTRSQLGYAIGQDGYVNYFTLPYTTANVISQKIASRTVNINPFAYPTAQGIINLSPNIDNWVDNSFSPALLITDPNMQVFSACTTTNILTVGDWQSLSSTVTGSEVIGQTVTSVSSRNVIGHGERWSPFGNSGYTERTTNLTTTTLNQISTLQQQNNLLGPYSSIGNTYSVNNGYITDISVLPWIRPQQVVVRVKGLLINTTVHTYFDKLDVDNYFRKANIIEVTGLTGTFSEGDTIGYYASGSFTPTARILGIYYYQGTTNARLYVAADGYSSTYTTNGIIQNAFFNSTGAYTSNSASATYSSTTHCGGVVRSQSSSTIQLSPTASSVDSTYVGQVIRIVSGTGTGQFATISSYVGSTRTATVSSSISIATGDLYSIGTLTTNENGNIFGIFNLPENTFHTGERVFRVDNSTAGNETSSTTSAEGTFYASGLSTQRQQLDFGASPAGAKGVFSQTNYQTAISYEQSQSSSSLTTFSPWDPVAQTFIVDEANFPNGLFLSSATFFFASKPVSDTASVQLTIVGTQNGYPNGETLDHGVVVLTPSEINVSSTPNVNYAPSKTTFNFDVPVYIQAGVLYSFILKSRSNEYTLWTASNGDQALSTSVVNSWTSVPGDIAPPTISKITSAPYVGGLFISQNSQTWTADQNQSLMFTVDRCVFDITANPSIQFVVPNKLPKRALIDNSIDYFQNANNITSPTTSSSVSTTVSSTDVLVDAFNISSTDFTPTTSQINYTYNATLVNGSSAGTVNINPGKYGTTMYDNLYLSDGKGKRALLANSNTSFSVYAQLSSGDPAISPVVSDAGLSVYTIKYNINNCELSNSIITLSSGGTGYLNGGNGVITSTSALSNTTISAPTGLNSSQAYLSANVIMGVIDRVWVSGNGSGYITTPTITINDSRRGGNSNASIIITGETSPHGGPAVVKYLTKKVVLSSGFDSGDLSVYLTAYRPAHTDILVYYKILSRTDTQRFEDGNWQLMTATNGSAGAFSKTRGDVYEYTFAPGTSGIDQGYVSYTSLNGQTYNTFSQFAIKIVLVSDDSTYVPYVNDLRVIALPSNINTTF